MLGWANMDSNKPRELDVRVTQLERQQVALRICMVVLVLVAVASMTLNIVLYKRGMSPLHDSSDSGRMKVQTSAEAPESIVQSFWDRLGNRRIDFGLASNSSPTLRFFGPGNGTGEMTAGHQHGRAFLWIYNGQYEKLFALDVFADGRSTLVMRSPGGSGGIFMEIDKSANPSIKLVGTDGSVLWRAPQ